MADTPPDWPALRSSSAAVSGVSRTSQPTYIVHGCPWRGRSNSVAFEANRTFGRLSRQNQVQVYEYASARPFPDYRAIASATTGMALLR